MNEAAEIQEDVLDSVSTPEEKAAAEAQGWREEPRENFKTAHDFLEYGQKIAPIQKERNEHLASEVAELKRSNQKMQEAFFKAQHDAKIEGYKKAKAELVKEQKRAFNDADESAYLEATNKLEELEPPKQDVPVKQEPQIDPEFRTWQAEKAQWYGTDIAMTAAADAIGARVNSMTNLQGVAFFDEVLKQVKKEFPHKFGNTNRQNANSVEGGGTVTGKSNGSKTFANLPSEIKAQADGVMKSFGYKSKDEYAKSWFKQADQYGWEY